MKIKSLLISAFTVLMAMGSTTVSAQSLSPSTSWHWEKGTIVIDTPQRPAGQKHVLELVTPKIETVHIGFVGVGARGSWAVSRITHIPGVEIVAICDYEPTHAERCQKYLRREGLAPADIYTGAKGYEALCKDPNIDVVYVATDWEHHFPVAKCALENGKHVAIEVPSAMNLEQCWSLINLAEQKRLHCMILENCCYDWFELDALNMAQHGLFGEVLFARGGYIHQLTAGWDIAWRNPENDPDKIGWRMKYNMENRGDIYATHGLGPVAQLLNIHRGDHFTKLIAMDTKAVHGKEYVEKKTGRPCENFRNGDVTNTMLRTAKGKMVEIQHSVMTPQPYSRLFQFYGTKGMANASTTEGFALSSEQLKSVGYTPKSKKLSVHSYMPKSERDSLRKVYRHPIIKKYGKMAEKVGGHGGMDFFMDARWIYCLQNGLPMDIDVYDLAEWCSLAELGALSIDNDNAAVRFPDFTRGYNDVVKGFRHHFAEPEAEAEAEKKADDFTAAHKEAVKKFDLWTLYDATKKGSEKQKAKALKNYKKAVTKMESFMKKSLQK